jgi:hypothetical protein
LINTINPTLQDAEIFLGRVGVGVAPHVFLGGVIDRLIATLERPADRGITLVLSVMNRLSACVWRATIGCSRSRSGWKLRTRPPRSTRDATACFAAGPCWRDACCAGASGGHRPAMLWQSFQA